MSEGDDATLPATRPSNPPSKRAELPDLGERYEVGTVLGRGGMGEIRLARDLRIHREVAVKLMRSPQRDDATLGRFFREARVQGVLDHPAVVPVHDLGIDPEGNPYFVMKRLSGTTLADVLVTKDPALRARWPRRQLLARLVDVCLAIEFAHTRGVIHRDLKPANIMLGDFGEAYVLDWGLARLATDREDLRLVLPLSGDDVGYTEAGDLLGTPGYMSPEQAGGETVDPRTDVFALGCVLFEILAGAPALPRGLAGLAAAIAAAEHRPSREGADVPPELDDLCAGATAADPAARPSARQLADGIQAYLDGDRDLVRRRDLAEEHAQAAHAAMDARTDEARAAAMRDAGRALALDPANALAQQVLGRLLVAAPTPPPAEALAHADTERAASRQAVFRWAQSGYLLLLLIVLGLFALPRLHGWPIAVTAIVSAGSWLIARRLAANPVPGRSPWFTGLLLCSAVQLLMSGVLFGPLLITPIFTIGSVAGFLSQPSDFRARVTVIGFTLPLVLLLGLELAGVLPQTIYFTDGALQLRSWVVVLTPVTTAVIVGLTFVTQLGITVLISASTMRVQREAQDVIHAQSWHLKQLLPRATDRQSARAVDPA